MANNISSQTLGSLDPNMTVGDLVKRLKRSGDLSNMVDDKDGGFSAAFHHIVDTLDRFDRTLITTVRRWQEVDNAAAAYAKTLGMTKKGMEDLRKTSMNIALRGNIGFDFGLNAADLINAQQSFSTAIGRNVNLNIDSARNIGAMLRIYGDNTYEFLDSFDKFGVSINHAGEHMGKMYSEASKSGLSLDKYAKNVQQGLALAQTYTFKDGLRGMEAMAKRATAIRMDLSQVQSFADKFSTVEDAIQNSAKLQVLGGSFTAGADPISLLNASLNDLEETQKAMENFTKGIAHYNKSTGQVDISTFDRLRLKEYANVTGQDYNKVMEVTRRQGMMGEIEAQMKRNANVAGFDKDFQELIKNTATIENGKAGVTINGEFKELSEITHKDQEDLIAQTRSQSEDIKQIAKDVRSITEIREGVRKQYEINAARAEHPVGVAMKEGTRILGDKIPGLTNWIMGAINLTAVIAGVSGAFKGLFRGFEELPNVFRGRGASGSIDDSANTIRRATRGARGAKNLKNIENSANAINRGTRTFKTAIQGTKTVRKAKQITNLVKAGKGAKVLGAGLKAAGKKLPIIGGLLSAGITAFENKDQFKDRQTRGKAVGKTAGAGVGAVAGAALGSLLGPVGTVLGGIAGEWLGRHVGGFIGGTVTKVQDWRRSNAKASAERMTKDKDAARAIGNLTGDYSVKQMREIQAAVAKGGFDKRKLSNKALKKLRESGDLDALEALQDNKDKKRVEAKAKRKEDRAKKKEERETLKDRRAERFSKILGAGKQTFGTARIEVGVGNFNIARQNGGLLGVASRAIPKGISVLKETKIGGKIRELKEKVPILRGKKEDGSSNEASIMKSMEAASASRGRDNISRSNGPIDVNINGIIKLETPNGQSLDILAEIKKSPTLLNQLTEMILKQANIRQNGAYLENRVAGDNMV